MRVSRLSSSLWSCFSRRSSSAACRSISAARSRSSSLWRSTSAGLLVERGCLRLDLGAVRVEGLLVLAQLGLARLVVGRSCSSSSARCSCSAASSSISALRRASSWTSVVVDLAVELGRSPALRLGFDPGGRLGRLGALGLRAAPCARAGRAGRSRSPSRDLRPGSGCRAACLAEFCGLTRGSHRSLTRGIGGGRGVIYPSCEGPSKPCPPRRRASCPAPGAAAAWAPGRARGSRAGESSRRPSPSSRPSRR